MADQLPQLTFFTELKEKPLVELFSDPRVVEQLVALNAHVSMGILDFSPGRARIVRQLNEAGIPLIAWQLLPEEQGYWFSLDSARFASEHFRRFSQWSSQEGLRWDAIGIDIEPHIDEFRELLTYNVRTIFSLFKRLWSRSGLFDESCAIYESLVERMHADGFAVHSYELFFVADERRTGSSLLSRLFGIAPTPADKHIGMLYSSLFRPFGVGLLRVYAPSFDSTAVGITGGGVELEGMQDKPLLSWQELSRDLLLARRATRDIHIFSLEGCVRQGYMDRLTTFDWNAPAESTEKWTRAVSVVRFLGTGFLWIVARPVLVVLLIASAGALFYWL